MFATAATTTQKRPMPRSSLCTYEFVVRIPTSTLQEHTCFKGNNGLNTSTNLPKSKKKRQWCHLNWCNSLLQNVGGTSHPPWHSEGTWSFLPLSLQASVAIIYDRFLHRPPRWVGLGISEASTVSPIQKRWKNGGFAGKGVDSNLGKCLSISPLSTIGIVLFMLRAGKTVNMTALPGLPAVLSGPKHVRSP